MMQHLPKLRGFQSHRAPVEIVYTGQLSQLKQKTIDNASLAESGLISSQYSKVKLLVKGELSAAVQVKLQAASGQAVGAVEKAGGKFEKTNRPARPSSAARSGKTDIRASTK